MPLRILTVCTANVCRSPMAAALIAQQCEANNVVAVVTSCGTDAGIAERDPNAIAVMSERGLSIIDHRPRLLTSELLAADGADLVVTMTRAHLRTVALMGAGVFQRSFTAKELVRRVGMLSEARTAAVGDIAGWRAALGEGRSAKDLLGESLVDDVEDPYGGPIVGHRRTADELAELAAAIAHSLAAW